MALDFFSEVRDWIDGFFSDEGFDAPRSTLYDHRGVGDLLPYRVFDEKDGIYYNDASFGFIVEINPQTHTSEIVGNLHSVIMSSMPANAGFQVINWSSPNISAPLKGWADHRIEGGAITEAMASSRIEHFEDRRFKTNSIVKKIPTVRRVFVCGWLEGKTSLSAISVLKEYKTAVLSALGVPANSTMSPAALIGLLSEVLHADHFGGDEAAHYTPSLPINAQLPGSTIVVNQKMITLQGEPSVSVTGLSVAGYPPEWDESFGMLLSGDPDRISDRPHGPLLISLSAYSESSVKASARILRTRGALQHSQKTGFSKFTLDFEGKLGEFDQLNHELEGGERLFQSVMTVMAYTEGGADAARSAGSAMDQIFRRVGFKLRSERYLQLPMLLGSLPFGFTSKHFYKLGRLQRGRLMKGAALTALAPFTANGRVTRQDRGCYCAVGRVKFSAGIISFLAAITMYPLLASRGLASRFSCRNYAPRCLPILVVFWFLMTGIVLRRPAIYLAASTLLLTGLAIYV